MVRAKMMTRPLRRRKIDKAGAAVLVPAKLGFCTPLSMSMDGPAIVWMVMKTRFRCSLSGWLSGRPAAASASSSQSDRSGCL